jgi:DNA replicative helicase MCM subunit Mcm2 (Cdc46/Mcm family)
MTLREKHKGQGTSPITARQLESLVRLTEAKAKVELREYATAEDANDILELFESSLSSAFNDEVIAVSALAQSIIIGTPVTKGQFQSKNQVRCCCFY